MPLKSHQRDTGSLNGRMKAEFHKVSSNSYKMMSAFDYGKKAKDLKHIDLPRDEVPSHKIFGLLVLTK